MNKPIKIAIIATAAALILGGGYLLYQRYYGGVSKITLNEASSADYDYRQIASDNGIVSDYLWMRTKQLMLGKDGDSLMIPSSYMIEGRLSYQDAESSEDYRLEDQAALLMMYIRSGDRIAALKLKEQVLSYYDFEQESNYELSAWLEAYLSYYSRYGSNKDLEQINSLTDILFDEAGNMREETLSVAMYDQGDFFSTVDTPQGGLSTLEQGTTPQQTEYTSIEGVQIASVNLRLIRNLENNGFLPAGSYDNNLQLVLDSKVSSGIPLYAYAYSNGIYIYSHDIAAAVDVEEAVITMRHLSEVNELPSDSYTWLKNQVFNGGTLRNEYFYSTGTTDGQESTDIYPDIMLIALELDDMDLYRSAVALEGMRVATYSNSPALSMIFREEEGRFVFYARENLLVCLAVT
ncbi:MAG: hypothetical protein IJ757_05090 [Clostridiales bacterium]|nr:hypothetical protein [Clostridiales bacterium]